MEMYHMKHTLQHAACVLDFATLHTCSSTLGSRVNACPSGVYHYSTTPVPSVNVTLSASYSRHVMGMQTIIMLVVETHLRDAPNYARSHSPVTVDHLVWNGPENLINTCIGVDCHELP